MEDYNFACFDTEDNSAELMRAGKSGFLKRVTQIAMIDAKGNTFYNKGDIEQFKKYVRQSKIKYWYIHNSQYDIGSLFSKQLDVIDPTLVKTRLIKAIWKDKVFLDSANIWPMSAKKLGIKFGLEKLESEGFQSKRYVFRDVEIIREAMLFAWDFAQSWGIEILPPTLGGLAMRLWELWGGVNCPDSAIISRLALYGGRVELFKGENDSDYVAWTDLNSLYPWAMGLLYPGPMEACRKLKEFGVATVTIEQPRDDIVTLPMRADDGRIHYPWGKIKGTWTIEEIRNATQNGAKILKVHDVRGTNEGIRPYQHYTEKLFALRQLSKSTAENEFLKLLMNNLYGRLSLMGEITRGVYCSPRSQDLGIPYGRKVLVNYKMPLDENVNWAHGAYVAAYGRRELSRYLRMVGADRLIYTDTDSAIFDCPDRKIPFPTGKELGQMKIIQRCSKCSEQFGHDKPCPGARGLDFWQDCITYAPKLYKAGNVFKAKGVPKKLAKEFIKKGVVAFDLPFKMREAIRFYDRDNSRELSVWRNVEKERQQEYDKKRKKGNRFYPCQWKG